MVTLDVNEAEFTRALRNYAARSEKALPRVMNQKMFHIGVKAARLTPKTTRGQIEKELGVVGYKIQYGKRGKALNKRMQGKTKNAITDSSSLIHLIINSRRGAARKKGLYGATMKAAVSKFLTARFRSVGTLKAGWTRAIRALGRSIGASFRNEGASSSVRGQSVATIARPGWNPTAGIEYNTNSFSKDHRPYIDRRLQAALAAAFNDEMQYMARDIKRGIDPENRLSHSQAVAFVERMLRGGTK